MTVPSAEHLLDLWENNAGAGAVHRSLAVLALACPESDAQEWGRAPIGQRDGALLALQRALFGNHLQTTATCPACGERVESEFPVDDVQQRPFTPPTVPPALRWRQKGYEIEYRLPSSQDLLAITGDAAEPHRPHTNSDRSGNGDDAAASELLRRCIARAMRGEVAVDPSQLPNDVVAELSAEMEQHDPNADLRMALQCPSCAHRWDLRFDIVSYFWDEIDSWAQRTLSEVHALASAYGWSEHEILGLSVQRRRSYLDMVGA